FELRARARVSTGLKVPASGVLYVDVPSSLSWRALDSGPGACAVVDSGGADGACAVQLVPGETVDVEFVLRGRADLVLSWALFGHGSALTIGVGERVEKVTIDDVDLRVAP